MSSKLTGCRYLRNLKLYETEKPFWCFLPPRDGLDPDKERVDNLEFEEQLVIITDLRGLEKTPRLEENGFEVLWHATSVNSFDTKIAIDEYEAETEDLLKENV